MALSESDLDSVVRTVAGEAGGEPPIGQQAVAHVIMNRAQSSGMAPADVVAAPGQFESWKTAKVQGLSSSDPTYQKVLHNITPALSGEAPDPTGGATHFLNPKLQADEGRKQPSWADGSGTQIGNHVFYNVGYSGQGHPSAPKPPSAQDIYAAIGFNPKLANQGDASAGSHFQVASPPVTQQAAPSTVQAAPTAPSADQIYKEAGFTPAPVQGAPGAPGAAPESPALTAARADAAKMAGQQDKYAPIGPADVMANSTLANLHPVLAGGISALVTGAQNGLAGLGVPGVKASPYGMGESFTANRDADEARFAKYGHDHPILNAGSTVAGMMGPSSFENLGAKAFEGAVERFAPKAADTLAGRLATKGGSAFTGGMVAGTGQATSEGQSAPDALISGAETGALSLPFMAAGEGANALANTVSKPLLRLGVKTAGNAALGAAGGAALAGLTGQNVGEGAETGAVFGASGAIGGKKGAKMTPKEATDTALDLLAEHGAPKVENGDTAAPQTRTADVLDAAPHADTLTAEALGDTAPKVMKHASEAAPEALETAVNERGKGSTERLVGDIAEHTGIDASTANQDVEKATDEARKGPAKEAYDEALTGKDVWNSELAGLAQEPEVKSALNTARRLMGSESLVPNSNPNAGQIPNRMSVEELRARMGQPSGPQGEVTTADLMEYLKDAGNKLKLAPEEPQQVPSDKTWDLAKKMLDKSITRDALGNAEDTPENALRQEWSRRLRGALDKSIPGYEQAREISGDYLSNRESAENGANLWNRGKNSEQLADFQKRYAEQTPAQQEFGKRGYLGELYRRIENGKFSPGDVLDSPFHRGALETMFGKEKADSIVGSLQRERDFAASKVAKTPGAYKGKEEGEDLAALGGALAGGEHGFNPVKMAKGAFAGVVASKARGVVEGIKNARTTPEVRKEVTRLLAQPAKQTAAELRLRNSARREVKLSQVNRANAFAPLARGAAIGAGSVAANALRGYGGAQ